MAEDLADTFVIGQSIHGLIPDFTSDLNHDFWIELPQHLWVFGCKILVWSIIDKVHK